MSVGMGRQKTRQTVNIKNLDQIIDEDIMESNDRSQQIENQMPSLSGRSNQQDISNYDMENTLDMALSELEN